MAKKLTQLTGKQCEDITVESAPLPSAYKGNPAMLLVTLNVVNGDQARVHKKKIQKRVNALGLGIFQKDIVSAPGKSVNECAESIKKNAH